jgi:hypothetical protein
VGGCSWWGSWDACEFASNRALNKGTTGSKSRRMLLVGLVGRKGDRSLLNSVGGMFWRNVLVCKRHRSPVSQMVGRVCI